MDDLNDIFIDLYNELLKNFTFYIPLQILEDDVTGEIFNLLNIDLTQEFVDAYVNKLLYIDADLKMKEVESFEKLKNSNHKKLFELDAVCFKLIHLKETIGKESYNFLFKMYMEQVTIFSVISNKLIQYFYIYYPNNAVDPTPIFIQQKNIFEKHLSDIEHKINIKGKKITTFDIISNLYKISVFKPYVVDKDISTAPEIKSEQKKVKEFKEFIIHDNKFEIERIVKTHFSDLRGVSLRYLIEFFIEEGVLILKHGDATKLYHSFEKLFDGKNIGAYTSIFDKKVFISTDKNYTNAKKSFKKIFENII